MSIKIIKKKSNLTNEIIERISKEYERTLVIPKLKLKEQIIVCPIGLIGAGKTTILKPLSKKLSLLRISTDEIREILKKSGYDYECAKEIAYKLIVKYIKKGFSIGIDADCISKESQKYIKELKKEYNIKVFWIHINPPEKFIINKLENYNHTWLFNSAKEAISSYKKRKSLHKNLNLNFTYVFDTSKDNLKNQINKAISIIKNLL